MKQIIERETAVTPVLVVTGHSRHSRLISKRPANPPPQKAAPPVTPDGRYLVVRGRLWRKSNPSLGAEQRQAQVAALMRARRALRDVEPKLQRQRARAAVERAKRALGERGAVWWSDGAPDYNRHLVKNSPYADWYLKQLRRPPTISAIGASILEALHTRAAEASACPSEIARRLAPDDPAVWRALMPQVRKVAGRLAARGKVRLTRGTQTLGPDELAGGPIRIRRGPKF